jgi:succinate dehydrogenase hydrophobic anchor subunit
MNEAIKAIGMMIISAIVLIVLSIIWFMILLFVVNVAADVVFSESLDPNWGVIAAALITLGSILGGSMGKTGMTQVFMKG